MAKSPASGSTATGLNSLLNESNAYFAAGGSFEYDALYEMIHTLQPDAYIHNNRHDMPLPGEDIQGFEQDLPGENNAGFNTTVLSGLPMEVCMTINDTWGVHNGDDNHKSTHKLVQNLVKSAGMNANYLLNVGPTALGEILPLHVQRLQEMGAWLRANGEGIYGTRAGVITSPDGVSTRRGSTTLRPRAQLPGRQNLPGPGPGRRHPGFTACGWHTIESVQRQWTHLRHRPSRTARPDRHGHQARLRLASFL